MTLTKRTLIALTTVALTLSLVSVAFASGESQCQVIYGGGEVCQQKIQFTIDKKVQSPTKGGDFVDNLSINDSRFQVGSNVTFKIKVTNTGDKTIERLDVTDTLPSNMTFVSGAGTYNKNNNTITYTINKLEKGASNEQTIVAKLADSLPDNQGVACLTNTASGTDNNGIVANDASAFCVEQPGQPVLTGKPGQPVYENVPVKKIPNTGPEMFSLIALIPAGLAGFALRKKSKLN